MTDCAGRPVVRPRVMFVSPVADFKGGAERSLFDLMRNPAVTPILVVPTEGPLSRAARSRHIACEVLPLGRVAEVRRPFRPGQAWLAAIDAFRAARRLKRLAATARGVGIIHTNGPKMHTLACMARLMGGPSVVVHVRQIPLTRIERAIWWCWSLCAARVVLVSRACWPSPRLPRHARIVPNAIEIPSIQMPAAVKDPIRIGFIGRIEPGKGLDVLLDWLARARDRGLRFELRIRGSATTETEEYARGIRCRAVDLALSERIRFDGFREGLAEIYEGLDVVVVPSIVPDALPRVVMEAQSFGIPVIAYPSGGIPEMITDRSTGYIVSTAEDFVAVLEEVMHEPDCRARIAAAAYGALKQRNSMARLHAEMMNVYAC